MMRLSLLLIVAISMVSCHESNVPYTDCHQGEIKSFYVNDCHKEAGKCVIHKNRDYQMEIKFMAHQNTGNSIKTRFLADLNGIEFGWPGIDGMEACGKHLQCPLKKGETYPFNMNFKFNNAIPNVNVKATFKLLDEHNKVLACAKTHIAVAD